MNDSYKDVNKRIFEIMDERGITQKELSRLTGIATSTISDWKVKGTTPTSDKIGVICSALHISPDIIFEAPVSDDKGSRTITEDSELWEFIISYDKISDASKQKILAYAKEIFKREK